MPSVTYTLTIRYPDEIDPETLTEIEAVADAQDTNTELRVTRWLGGFVSEGARQISEWLPEGFSARVSDDDGRLS